MTKDEALFKVNGYLTDIIPIENYSEVEEIIKALKQEPCEDCISRQDALKPFCIAPDGTRIPEVDCDNFHVEFSVEFIKKHLLSLPSAEPKTDGVLEQVRWERDVALKTLEEHGIGFGQKPKTDDENELKFYYVESLDDYWIGRRLDNFYYATWHEGLGFVWSHSRYLPWGEHIVDERTLWKEHTYPSEPIEIPFTEWIVGFVKKYFAEPKTGHWVRSHTGTIGEGFYCSRCGKLGYKTDFCPNCGADMREPKLQYGDTDTLQGGLMSAT